MAELENTVNTEAVENTESTQTKTYSQAEVDELLQKESDRRVSQALAKQEKKNAEKMREAQKLANMDAQQKYEYELNQREQAIIAKEKELALMENKNEASKILASKGISLSLVDFVVADDAETMANNISLLEKEFKDSVKKAVEAKLGSTSPKVSSNPEDIYAGKKLSEISVAELQKIKIENPELFEKLIK